MGMNSSQKGAGISGERLRVLIADDHIGMRIGVSSIVQSMGNAEVVGEAANGEDAIAQYQSLRPDVLTLDLRMPGLDGQLVIEQIVADDPKAQVLVMTMFDQEEDVYNAMRAGAKGYVLKSSTRLEMIAAIRAVGSGERYLPTQLAEALAARLAAPTLTPREREVLEWIQKGNSNKQIARELNVAEGTVKAHVSEILTKLGAISRTEAVNFAVRRGLLK
jgi:DNA-binding NarL/FixJ family response regulator